MATKTELAEALSNAAVKLAERAAAEGDASRAQTCADAAQKLTEACVSVTSAYLD